MSLLLADDPASAYYAKQIDSEKQNSQGNNFPCLKYSGNFAIITENYDIGLLPKRDVMSDDIRRLLLAGCSKRPSDCKFPQTSG